MYTRKSESLASLTDKYEFIVNNIIVPEHLQSRFFYMTLTILRVKKTFRTDVRRYGRTYRYGTLKNYFSVNLHIRQYSTISVVLVKNAVT